MAINSTVKNAVLDAIATATLDPDAAREPLDERVRFDVDRLARVMKLAMRNADQYNAVVAVAEDEMHRQIRDEHDVHRALAALRLQERVTAPHRRFRLGPDGEIEIVDE